MKESSRNAMKRKLLAAVGHPLFGAFEKVVAVLANVAVLSGVLFALDAVRRASHDEQRRTAIEAITPTRSPEFLQAYARLKATVQTGSALDASTVNDLNLVANTYDNIAVLLQNDLADTCVVKHTVHQSLQEVLAILNRLPYPADYRRNIDAAAALLAKTSCGK